MKIRKLLILLIAALLLVSCTAQPEPAPSDNQGRQDVLKELSEVPEDLLNAKDGPTKITLTAILLTWPRGTDKAVYSYPDGSPTDNFKKAIDAVYPNRSSWSDAPRAGASCDVFVGTVVRTSGYDPDYPRGWDDQYDYLQTSKKWTQVPYSGDLSALKDGDIILYKRNSGRKHTCIFVEIEGKPYLAEAQIKKYFGYLNSGNKKVRQFSNKQVLVVYRAVK
jgi:hypothetical protein